MYPLIPLLALAALLHGCARDEAPAAVPASAQTSAGPHDIVLPLDSPMRDRLRIVEAGSAYLAADVITAPARIEADPTRRARVRVPVPGRVLEVHVLPGDRVETEQLLLTLQSPEAGTARAQYRQALVADTMARRAMERARELHAVEAFSERDLLAAETEQAQAAAELSQAEYLLQALRVSPDDTGQQLRVHAPRAGRVIEIDVAHGEFVNDIEEAVMTIADLAQVWAIAAIPETQLRRLDPAGSVVAMLPAFPDERFEGRLLRIADTLDAETRTVSAFIELDNSDGRLRPNMFGVVQLRGHEADVTVVPVGTVVYHAGATRIVVETEPGIFNARDVVVRARQGDWIPVVSGIAPGERVVVDGGLMLLGHATLQRGEAQ